LWNGGKIIKIIVVVVEKVIITGLWLHKRIW